MAETRKLPEGYSFRTPAEARAMAQRSQIPWSDVARAAGRRAGMAVESGFKGSAAFAGMFVDPVIMLMRGAVQMAGKDPSNIETLYEYADRITREMGGAPTPETIDEKAQDLIAQGALGGVLTIRGAQALQQSANPILRRIGETIARHPYGEVIGGGAATATPEVARTLGAPEPVAQALGMAAGTVGGGISETGLRGTARVVRGADAIRETFTEKGREGVVGDILHQRASDPRRAQQKLQEYTAREPVLTPQDGPVPAGLPIAGTPVSQQPTGAVAMDLGLIGLHRVLANVADTPVFGEAMSQANAARMRVMNVLAGEDVARLRAERGAATKPGRERLIGKDKWDVEGAEFGKWYEGSKLVDEEGKPIVLYHGTQNEFRDFSPEKIGSKFPEYSFGIFASDSPDVANIYAAGSIKAAIDDPSKILKGGNVRPFYLKAKNPLEIGQGDLKSIDPEIDNPGIIADQGKSEIVGLLEQAKEQGKPYDSVIIQGRWGDNPDHKIVAFFDSDQAKPIYIGPTPEELKPFLPRVNTKPLLDHADRILKGPQRFQEGVYKTVSRYRDKFEQAENAQELYAIRKSIGEEFKATTPESAEARLAEKQLIELRKIIDNQIELAAPGWKENIRLYAELSKVIDQQETMQKWARDATLAVRDPSSEAKDYFFNSRLRRLVDGQRIAKGRERILLDEQLDVLDNIIDDYQLGQAINAASVRPSGSDTAKNLSVAHVIGRITGGRKETAPIVRMALEKFKGWKMIDESDLQDLLMQAMLNPRLAARLMAEANPRNIARAQEGLQPLLEGFLEMTKGGALTPAATIGAQISTQQEEEK